jgi:hypothetical protein
MIRRKLKRGLLTILVGFVLAAGGLPLVDYLTS